MSDNKPPMTVWLTGKQTPCEATNKKHDVFSQHGPYVNLEQFMKEVERRAAKLFGKSFHTATLPDCVSQSLKELAQEIEEGKA